VVVACFKKLGFLSRFKQIPEIILVISGHMIPSKDIINFTESIKILDTGLSVSCNAYDASIHPISTDFLSL
jgi:hypothetical protein